MNEDTVSESNEQQNTLQEQLQAAQREAAENRDKYLRALAESENARKRVERLCEDRIWQEKKRLVMHLVELADQLEEALKYTSDDDPVANGLRITYQHLQHVLAQEGAQVVKAVGEAFDPNVHEAIELADGAGEPNEVTLEYRKGYLLDGKLLRPARVQVRRAA
jgi:molecular chaperone GrpE